MAETTIGYAVLQIIPSLKGVSEAIEKQLAGQVVAVEVEPKTDAAKIDKSVRDAVKKSKPAEVQIDPKVDAAKINAAVKDSVKKSKPPEVQIDPKIDPSQVKKQAEGVGKVLRDTINGALKDAAGDVGMTAGELQSAIGEKIGGYVGSTIGDAIRGAINNGGSISDALQNITGSVGGALSGLGDALSTVNPKLGELVTKAGPLPGILSSIAIEASKGGINFGNLATHVGAAGTELSKFDKNAPGLEGKLGKAGEKASLLAGAFNDIKTAVDWLSTHEDALSHIPGMGVLDNVINKYPQQAGSWLKNHLGLPSMDPALQNGPGHIPGLPGYKGPAPGTPEDPTKRKPQSAPPTFNPGSGGGSFDFGGYTGALPVNQIAGVVHGGEFVISKWATDRVQNAVPGLLDFLNKQGKLPGFEGGGLVDQAKRFASSMDSAKYLMGGFSPTAIDCSGFVAAVANVATGRPPFQSRMSTVTEGSWLASLGFQSGRGKPGDLRIGWWDRGGGANGHTAGTFPDGTNFESNGSEGVVVGGSTGADSGQFTSHAFLPGLSAAAGAVGGFAASAAPEAATSVAAAPAAAAPAAATARGSGGSGGGFSIPSSISDLAGVGLSSLGQGVGATSSGSDLSLFGNAAASAVSGQVSSALGVFGVPNTPGWLQGISKFVGGISVGGAGGGGFGGPPSAAIPASAAWTPGAAAQNDVHSMNAGGPQTVFNIQTARVEDAFVRAKQREAEKAVTPLGRWG